MSERALQKVKTSSGVELELVEYITGGEGRSLGLMSNDLNSPQEKEKLQDKMIELCVKSVNGNKDNVLQSVVNLRIQDYLEVIQKCNELFGGLSEEKKTQ